MVISRRAAYSAVVAIASAAFAFSAVASLWVAPQALELGTPGAYASFQDGSIFGIVLFTVIWTFWSFACVAFVLVNLKRSDAWVRRGRHRFISLGGSALMTYGLIGTASWMPYLEVDLAMEHVIPWQQRDGSASTLFQFVWVTAACAILAALILGAVGAAFDRAIGKAPILAVG
jgi:hypothetical protein